MKLCAGIITYYPDLELLKRNVLAYYDYVEKIVIWQNTPIKDRLLHEVDIDEKIVYLGEDNNCGISYSLNQVVAYCNQEGFSHLLTMDQDSVFENFEYYLEQVKSLYDKELDLVQTGPEINKSEIEYGNFQPCRYVITSGSIIDLKKSISLGGFRQEFFVDGIDLDFGYKINQNGGKVFKIGGAILNQNFGNTYKKGDKRIISYSPKRLHDTVMSQIVLWKEYPNYFHKFLFLKIYYLYTPLNILVYQDDKWEKIKSIIEGTIAGIRYK